MAEKIIILSEFEDNIDFYYEWILLENLSLKVLILVSVLANNNLIYKGSLSEMCLWLGMKSNGTNNDKIKKALNILQNKKHINYYRNGRTYTIEIINAEIENKKILRIRKSWLNVLKSYKGDVSISWIQLVKVFIYICSKSVTLSGSLIVTRKEIANYLNISATTVGNALKCIAKCNFDGLLVEKQIEKEYIKNGRGQVLYALNIGINVTLYYKW